MLREFKDVVFEDVVFDYNRFDIDFNKNNRKQGHTTIIFKHHILKHHILELPNALPDPGALNSRMRASPEKKCWTYYGLTHDDVFGYGI